MIYRKRGTTFTCQNCFEVADSVTMDKNVCATIKAVLPSGNYKLRLTGAVNKNFELTAERLQLLQKGDRVEPQISKPMPKSGRPKHNIRRFVDVRYVYD